MKDLHLLCWAHRLLVGAALVWSLSSGCVSETTGHRPSADAGGGGSGGGGGEATSDGGTDAAGGMGGQAGTSGAGGTPAECNLVTQDCGANEFCVPGCSGGDPKIHCQSPPGKTPVGGTCVAFTDCEKGTACVAIDNAGPRCHKFCARHLDCGGAMCVQAKGMCDHGPVAFKVCAM